MDPLGPIDRVQAGMIDPERFARAQQIQAAAPTAKARVAKVAESAIAKVPTAAPKIGMMQATRGVAAKALPVVGQGMALYGAGRALGGAAGAVSEGNYGDVIPAAARGFAFYE